MVTEVPGDLILKTLCGSRAYGLETPESDYDYHGVYVAPTQRFFELEWKGVTPVRADIKNFHIIQGDDDGGFYEVGHFCQMAATSNPTVLETLVGPTALTTEWGTRLIALFPFFVTRQRVRDAFLGYSWSQRKKMFDPPEVKGSTKEQRMLKAAVAWIRVLYHGIQLLSTGTFTTKLDSLQVRRLIAVRQGEVSVGEIVDRASQLEELLLKAYDRSSLPEAPDMDRINAFLFNLRKEFWA